MGVCVRNHHVLFFHKTIACTSKIQLPDPIQTGVRIHTDDTQIPNPVVRSDIRIYTISGSGGGTSILENGTQLEGNLEGFTGYDSNSFRGSDGNGYVLFTNTIDTEQLSKLYIRKELTAGTTATDETFDMYVTVNGVALPVDTQYTIVGSNEVCRVNDVGIIPLQAGQTALLLSTGSLDSNSGIVAGSTYTVTEQGATDYTISYSGKIGTYDTDWTEVENTATGDTGFAGTVTQVASDTLVTVTNSDYDIAAQLELNKTLTGVASNNTISYAFDFEVTEMEQMNGSYVVKDGGKSWTTSITSTFADGADDTSTTLYFGFKSGEADGPYYYKVSEDIPESITNGISYDANYYIVAVTVNESDDGSRTASVTGVTKYSEDGTADTSFTWSSGAPIPFTNALGGDLSITKVVEYTGKPDYVSKEVFAFEVTVTGASGSYKLSYTMNDTPLDWDSVKDYTGWPESINPALPREITFSGDTATVYIPAGATLTIQDLPATAQAKITETNTDGYSVKWSGNTATGAEMPGATVTTTEISNNPAVTCTNTTGAVLPSTGGPGVAHILTLGAMLALGAGALLLLQQRRKEGREP